MDPNISEDKFRELGEKLIHFSEDGPIQWPVAPFQMQQEFAPQFGNQFQGWQAAAGNTASSGYSGYGGYQTLQSQPYVPVQQGYSSYSQADPSSSLTAQSFDGLDGAFLGEPSYSRTSSHHQHQRVPSLGNIDSETNPIAASLLMSFKSIISSDRKPSREEQTLQPLVSNHHSAGHQQQPHQSHHQPKHAHVTAMPQQQHGHHNNSRHQHNLQQQHQQHQQQHHNFHQHNNNGYYSSTAEYNSHQQRPPPAPPQQSSDCWSPYQLGDSAAAARMTFSDVVKKSLSEVAPATQQQQQTVSRPVTPAPSTVSNASVPSSPAVNMSGGSMQNANFSLASSRSNLSRNGKPIVVAKVEPMQVTANRYAAAPAASATKPVSGDQQQQQLNKVRRARSSTTGGLAMGDLASPNDQYGSADSVFDGKATRQQRISNKSSLDQSECRGADTCEESERGFDGEEDNVRTADDDTDEGRETENERNIKQRNTGRQSSKTLPRKSTKRSAKTAESSSGKSWMSDVFFNKLGGFLSQLGPWIVFFFAKFGSLFRFLLYIIVQTLCLIISNVFSTAKEIVNVLRRLFFISSGGDGGTRSQRDQLALIERYGLPRPIILPTTSDAAIRRLMSLADADAYTIIGCRYNASQDDIVLRIRQLTRLVASDRHYKRSEEAEAVLARISNEIGTREARMRYNGELVAQAELAMKAKKDTSSKQVGGSQVFGGQTISRPNLTMTLSSSSSSSAMTSSASLFSFYCLDCGLSHQLVPVMERQPSEARMCSRCGAGVLHQADVLDVWAETIHPMGSSGGGSVVYDSSTRNSHHHDEHSWRFFACLDVEYPANNQQIYDVTDIIGCCRSRMKVKMEGNAHSVTHRLELLPTRTDDAIGQQLRKFSNLTGDNSIARCFHVRLVSTKQQQRHQQQQQQQHDKMVAAAAAAATTTGDSTGVCGGSELAGPPNSSSLPTTATVAAVQQASRRRGGPSKRSAIKGK